MAKKDPNLVEPTDPTEPTEPTEETEEVEQINEDGLPLGVQLTQAQILQNDRKHAETLGKIRAEAAAKRKAK